MERAAIVSSATTSTFAMNLIFTASLGPRTCPFCRRKRMRFVHHGTRDRQAQRETMFLTAKPSGTPRCRLNSNVTSFEYLVAHARDRRHGNWDELRRNDVFKRSDKFDRARPQLERENAGLRGRRSPSGTHCSARGEPHSAS